MRELWQASLEWDTPLPDEFAKKWDKIKGQISFLDKMNLPRYVVREELPKEIHEKWEHMHGKLGFIDQVKYLADMDLKSMPSKEIALHGFCDAAKDGYSAMIYIKGKVRAMLLVSKNRLSPTKIEQSIPRLELNACLILAQLMTTVKQILYDHYPNIPTYYWSDSQVALAWLKNDANLGCYVGNRVRMIKNLTAVNDWHYVPTKENPADLGTRPYKTSAAELLENDLWWHGPNFLMNKEDWPKMTAFTTTIDVIPPEKQDHTDHRDLKAVVEKYGPIDVDTFIRGVTKNFQSLKAAVKIIARMLRWKTMKDKMEDSISAEEFRLTLHKMIKLVQEDRFQIEYNHLKKDKRIPEQVLKSSKLKKLFPFIDNDGVLRVTGRIQEAPLPYCQRHPAILPKNCPLTDLIIRYAHIEVCHGGFELTKAYLRQQGYWVLQEHDQVRVIIDKCRVCNRLKLFRQEQLMGNLPAERLHPSFPFNMTAVDYAGPIIVRPYKGTKVMTRSTSGEVQPKHKGWIALFICMTTKAIHLEVVSDCTSESFLLAFHRFVGRRGLPQLMYSDNGTTFQGVMTKYLKIANVIRENEKYVRDKYVDKGLIWKFSPPYTPHYGGLHEANIKSMKSHLHKVLKDQPLTYEEYATVLVNIEACLNSRPLCPIYQNEVTDVLTPGHFLIGRALKAPPLQEHALTSLQERNKQVLKYADDITKKWKTDVLNDWTQRKKWQGKKINYKIGDIVMIKHCKLPRNKWPIGIIVKDYPDSLGAIRKYTMRTLRKYSFDEFEDEEETKRVGKRATDKGGSHFREITRHVRDIVPLVQEKPTHLPLYMQSAVNGNILNQNDSTTEMKALVSNADTSKNGYSIVQIQSEIACRVQIYENQGEEDTSNQETTTMLTTVNQPNSSKEKNQKTSSQRRTVEQQMPKQSKRAKLNLMMTMILIFTLFNCISAIKITPLKTGGVILTHISKTYIEAGQFHLALNTGINSTSDQILVEKTIGDYTNLCKRQKTTTNNGNTNCNEFLDHLQDEAAYIRRQKRSKGALSWLWDHLVGSDEAEVQLEKYRIHQDYVNSRTTGVLSGVLHHINETEQEVQAKVVQLQRIMNLAAANMMQMNNLTTEINKESLDFYMLTAYEHALALIRKIEHRYDEIKQRGFVSQQRFTKQLEQIQQLLPKNIMIMPNITADITQNEVRTVNEMVYKILEIPLVFNSTFELFKATSLPEDQHIVLLEDNYISINNERMEYVTTKTISYFKATNIIMMPNQLVKTFGPSMPCLAMVAIHKQLAEKECRFTTAPTEYDIWEKPNPNVDTFIYATTFQSAVVIICNGTQSPVPYKRGIIELDKGCFLNTWSGKYQTSSNIHSTIQYNFFVPLKRITIGKLNLINNTVAQLPHITTTWNLKTNDINELETTLKKDEPVADDSTWIAWVAGTSGSVLAIILIALICYCWCCCSCKNCKRPHRRTNNIALNELGTTINNLVKATTATPSTSAASASPPVQQATNTTNPLTNTSNTEDWPQIIR